MILEMLMESIFALVDILYVSKVSVNAVATIGLTESVITLVYAVTIGLSMAATTVVARRVGEKDLKGASNAAVQVIFLGVLVIIMTIMVLELKVPHGGEFEDLKPLLPVFGSYILSFIYLAIYWNNHHMMQTVKYVTGSILWANMHLLFWLSLIPFVTGWMGENHFTTASVFLYGIVLLFAAFAYFLLQILITKSHGKDSILALALGKDLKGKASPIIYTLGIISAFYYVWISGVIFILVAIMWLIPDSRIEKVLKQENNK